MTRAWLTVGLIVLAGLSGACRPQFRAVPPLVGRPISGLNNFDPQGKLVLGNSRTATPGDSGSGLIHRLGDPASIPLGAASNNVVAATDWMFPTMPREGEATARQVLVGNGPSGPFQAEMFWTDGLPTPPVSTEPIALPAGSQVATVAYPLTGELRRGAVAGAAVPLLLGTDPVGGPFVAGMTDGWFAGPVEYLPAVPGATPFDSLQAVDMGAAFVVAANQVSFIQGDETTPDRFEATALRIGLFDDPPEWFPAFPGYVDTAATSVAGGKIDANLCGAVLNRDVWSIAGYGRRSASAPFRALVMTPFGLLELPHPAGFEAFSSYALAVATVLPDPESDTIVVGGSVETPAGPRAVLWIVSISLGSVDQISTIFYNEPADLPIGADDWSLSSIRSIRLNCAGIVYGGAGVNPAGVEQAWFIADGDFGVAVPPFDLRGPEDGAVLGSVSARFRWFKSVEEPDFYRVEVSTTETFEPGTVLTEEVDAEENGTNFNNLLPETLYFWRVTAVKGDAYPVDNGRDIETVSAVWSFTTGTSLTAPVLVAPNDGAAVNTTDGVTFTWEAVANATEYELTVTSDGGASFQLTLPDTSLNLSYDELACNALYAWSVTARNAGAGSPPSETRTFTTVSSAPTAAEITGPSNGATDPLPLTITWTRGANLADQVVLVFDAGNQVVFNSLVGREATSVTVPSDVLTIGDPYYTFIVSLGGCGEPNEQSSRVDFVVSAGCPADYNSDTFLNLDDLNDFITDFYFFPPIPGGLQPEAPTYSDVADVGYSAPCSSAPNAPMPYLSDAYRDFGYRVGYSSDGNNSCPQSEFQSFPNLDNLNDYITFYYEEVFNPGNGCAG